VFFLSLVYAATAQYMIYIYVNGNEVKEHK
jgi:hypothetical protein